MSENRGLGKGLDGLFAPRQQKTEKIEDELIARESTEKEKTEKESITVQEIEMEKIRPRKDQPRKHFDEEALENLKNSILEVGLLQPIVLIEDGEEFEIVAGERRFRGAKMAGLDTIPAIIKKLSEKEIHEMSLIENIQREDLNPIEEATAFEHLLKEFDYTQQELGDVLGKSRSVIANTLRLLDLDEKTREYLISGEITSSQGRTLLSIKDLKKRHGYLNKLLNKETSIQEIERSRRRPRVQKEKDPFVKDLEDQLIGFFGTRVSIREKKKGGQIEIEYLSNDDLERILSLFED